VTEGWGAYIRNIGDAALGDFIDGIGQTFGMDLCQPDFQFKLAVKIGLDSTQPKQARCTFSQMMTNWQSAISNANFAVEYQTSMRPGENDISYALIMADRRNSYVADAVREADKTLGIDGMWLPIKNIAGNILTPGTFIREKFFKSPQFDDKVSGMDIFTGTPADFIEEFLNTLVAELLKNLQLGFFGSGGGAESSARGSAGSSFNVWDAWNRISSLFNPFASPIVIGEEGAKERFFNLTESQIKVGGSYDILAKLSQCSETAKTNPGPTDCVIDQKLFQAIRNRNYVDELPSEVKNRLFAPQGSNADNLENAISYRSILIMRKYRIIPVGWEIAAKMIQNMSADTAITLDELLTAYEDPTSQFYRLVEPYWLLKAPEVYCRRLGYSAHNTLKDSQDGAISRSEYCADEQQCLREDNKGNCLAYGYCQEERRFWRLGTECDARFNTCQTYGSRSGSSASWLTNTLDFRYCSNQNVGCRSLATVFNYNSKEWNGDVIKNGLVKRYNAPDSPVIVTSTNIFNGIISEGQYTNDAIDINNSQRIRMLLSCSESSCGLLGNICSWDATKKECKIIGTCTIPAGAISCSLDNCNFVDLTLDNPSFQTADTQLFNAASWTDERSYFNINNRHYRAEVFGKDNATTSALRLVSVNNSNHLITTLDINPDFEPGNRFKLKFWLKGTISQGNIAIGVFFGPDADQFYRVYPTVESLGGRSLSSGSSIWREVEFEFDTVNQSLNTTNTKLAIITNPGSVTDLYLDDFSLQRTSNPECLASGVKLYRAVNNNSTILQPSNIHLDRDAESCDTSSEGCTEFISTLNNQAAYLKKAPSQFQCYGLPSSVTSSYPTNWPATNAELLTALSGRKPECSFFAQLCVQSEVGCELYRPVNGDPDVPGVVSTTDYCPAQCVGYQVYKQEQTNFTNSSFRQFIADSNALYCSASHVGCDEFTNLNKLAQGAEEKEYFSSFRRCQINNDPLYDDASPFYTWEGSDTTGYQLVSYNLKGSVDGAPCTSLTYDTATGKGDCNSTDLRGVCSQAQMITNSDCRQFYDSTGEFHFRLLSKTIIVSNNCNPYRRTQTEAGTGAGIAEAEKNCKDNGGWWKASDECVYMGDPDFSQSCPASAKGCRTYTGNRGNNIRKVVESHFDGNNLNDLRWVSALRSINGLQISLEATFPGGYSLTNIGSNRYLRHPVKLTAGRSYTLSFWAKSDNDFTFDLTNSSIYLMDTIVDDGQNIIGSFDIVTTTGSTIVTSSPQVTMDWQYYELGPVFITQDYTDGYLRFRTPQNVHIYLDNVILKETTNNVYLVENSWFTPVACDNDFNDPAGTQCASVTGQPINRCSFGEHLGCSAYYEVNNNNNVVNLRSFSSLCRPEAVGCSELIDTFNLSNPGAQSFNTTSPPVAPAGSSTFDRVDVPANRTAVYLVNNARYQCPREDKGCQALGLPLVDAYDRIYGYRTVFLKNNPDRYSTDLCRYGEVWCEEFAGNNSLNYFKDPRNKLCEYRDVGVEPGWYKTGTIIPCDTTFNQTYGTGYAPPSEKEQPIGLVNNTITNSVVNGDYSGWIGTCPATQSSCSEYVDFLRITYPQIGQKTITNEWEYKFKPYTLYSSNVAISDPSLIRKDAIQYLYYVNSSSEVTITTSTEKDITMTGVYYSLRDSVDYSSCNGLVDFRNGCILVDDRSQIDYSTSSVNWDGRLNYLTYGTLGTYWNNMALDGGYERIPGQFPQAVAPSFVNASNANASKIVKAVPDRACNKWLYCTTYEKKDAADSSSGYGEYDTCLDIASCSYTDKEGRCLTFADYGSPTIENYSTSSRYYNNQTGYAMVGFTYPTPPITGYYKIQQMTQEGEGAFVPNSGFEDTFGDTVEPVGWNSYDGVNPRSYEDIKQPVGWAGYKFASIFDPKNAPEGSSYLMVNTAYQVISEEISVVPYTDYIMSFWYNTMNLEIPNATPHLFVGVYRLTTTGGVNNPDLSHLTMDYKPLSFSVYPAGKDWFRQEITFNSTSSDKVIVVLKNCPNNDPNKCLYDPNSYRYDLNSVSTTLTNSCGDLNQNTACALSGHSLLDDIQIKPVLKVNNDTNFARTCRVFPAKDAKSCTYWDNNNFYYGQYGYCLMTDPKNSKQCLQWYPVDNLKGEMAREISGYAGRAPLYYCIERATTTIDISHGAGGISINESALNEEWSGLASLETGRDVRFKAFDVDPEYQVFMRYPFIRFFTYTGGFVALAGKNASVKCAGGPLWAAMHPYGVVTGMAGVLCTDKDNNSAAFPIMPALFISSSTEEQARFKSDWEMYKNQSGKLHEVYSGLNSWLGNLFNASNQLACNGVSAVAGFLFPDKNPNDIKDAIGCKNGFDPTRDGWGGWGMIHGPFGGSGIFDLFLSWLGSIFSNALSKSEYGTIWPVVWGVADGQEGALKTLMGTALDSLSGDKDQVKSSGMMQMKIVTQDDPSFGSGARDPIPDLGGDVLGVAVRSDAAQQEKHFMTTIYGQLSTSFVVNYCKKFVRVVTSAGDNKALVGRVNPGSGYVLTYNRWGGFFDIVTTTRRYYYDPFDYDKFMADPDNYRSSDYAPFGSLVQPLGYNDPGNWDSRDGKPNKQPLYQEPPRTQGYAPPYQARMGELHSVNGLKRLFAQSYGVWEWKDFSEAAKSEIYNGYYRSDAGSWSVPTSQCSGARVNSPCWIKPILSVSTIPNGNYLKLFFTVKADPDQLPITGITINWGDGVITSYTGTALRNRTNPDNNFTFYHIYKEAGTYPIKIRVIDNWGIFGEVNTTSGEISF
jgi:hypothetical protein